MASEQLTIGSLCTGYGGLDLAAEALLDAHTIWCAEFEEAPSRVIEARFPGVPNMHDVKRIPWHIMAPIDIMTAGYPCQPFSVAGDRKGVDDPRHLWPSIAEGIRIMRPRHVLLENVRGHLTLGFDQVLWDLNNLGYAVAWRILPASAVGACHKRERLFIYAQPAEFVNPHEHRRTWALAGLDGWLAAEADLFGERAPWGGRLPAAGIMHRGRIREITVHTPTVSDALFRTPVASETDGGPRNPNREGATMRLSDQVREEMFPTPRATDGSKGGPNQRGSKGDLMLPSAVAQLLPTPKTTDGHHSSPADANRNSPGLRAIESLLPTPVAQHSHNTPQNHLRKKPGRSRVTDLAILVENDLLESNGELLFPTPDAYQGSRGGSQDPEKRREGGHTVSLADVIEKGGDVALLPTPKAGDAAFGLPRTSGRSPERSTFLATRLAYDTDGHSFGAYSASVLRHQSLVNRAAPPPTAPSASGRGKPQLAPKFVEWMMCLPEERVTDPALWAHLTPSKARDAQLKMLGNGVVPPQALAAYKTLATAMEIRHV